LWGVSIYVHDLGDSWIEPPAEIFKLTRAPDQAPDQPATIILGFEAGIPCSLDGTRLEPLPLIKNLNRLGGEHGIGRSDVIEDRLFGIKSREFYEAPAAELLQVAHRDLESTVQSRELITLKDHLSRRFAELAYMGLWFHDLRKSLQAFFVSSQQLVTGEVRMKLYKGGYSLQGRRSPHSLFDPRLASQANLEWFDSQWAEGFTSLYTLPSRLAARRPLRPPDPGGWTAP
jgi:argininosuccinate synthase